MANDKTVRPGRHVWFAKAVTAGGQRETLRVNRLISGVGALNRSRLSDIPGLGGYRPAIRAAALSQAAAA